MKQGVKKSIFLIGIIGIVALAGCGKMEANGEAATQETSQEEMKEVEGTVEMTQEQMDLLIGRSVNQDRVREGKLYSWQQEILNQYDYAMEYLKEKYQSHSFHMVSCDPKSKLNSFSQFRMTADEDSETYYDLYLYSEEADGTITYEAKDNFYSAIITKPYESYVLDTASKGVACIAVDSSISSVEGSDYNENMTVEDIKEGRLFISPITTIYVDGSKTEGEGYDSIVEQIKENIKEEAIQGYYTVLILSEVPKDGATVKELQTFMQENKDSLKVEKYTF